MQTLESRNHSDEASTTVKSFAERTLARSLTCARSATSRTNGRGVGILVASSILALAISSCGCPDALYEELTESPEVRLPLDEAPHCQGAEWWYYTGLLVADDAREYGVEAVIFQASPGVYAGRTEGTRIVTPITGYVAHFAITDVADQTFSYDQRRSISPQPTTPDGFHLETPLLTLRGSEGHDFISGTMSDDSYEIDLELVAETDAVLHGENGYVRFGPTGYSFYYSRPWMKATGTLRDGDEVLSVTGDLWFDRQWGRDLTNPFLSWDWFAIRLDDDGEAALPTAIMLYRFIDAETPGVEHGTLIHADGSVSTLNQEDFTITNVESWTSPATGTTYAVRWKVEIPQADLVLDINRVLDDQEIDASSSTLTVYWEGLCNVTGTRGGESVSGHAYVEMTNYNRS